MQLRHSLNDTNLGSDDNIMNNREWFKNKKVSIIGFARSGLSCANLLFDLGANVYITDIQDNEFTRKNLTKLKSSDIKVELGKHSIEFIQGSDLIVVSPGVPDMVLPVHWAKELGIPLLSELEIASMLCPAQIIAVTGSNGKTTVTTLIGKILQAVKKKAFVCGNIGDSFSGELFKMKEPDYAVVEVSSFQLERVEKFKPKIAVITNFSKNHLDRYKDMQEYLEAKKRIFMNQDSSDYLVLYKDDPLISRLAAESAVKKVYFQSSENLNPNQAAVLAVGEILNIDRQLILEAFRDFKGIEHRMEEVAEINKVRFINDSKATNVDSAIWALNSVSGPVVLIAGGKDKGVDYRLILDSARDKVKEVILIGEARVKIKQALEGFLDIDQAESLKEAVDKAFCKAKAGDSVLLSPMCSSFDMFQDYEHRGRVFKELVYDLKKNAK
ncbi:MAG: UDP-N-acetylmuramoyl-L-alanine--D-glutamate ligase [Candidatus Omnitrophota bacterium]